MMIRRRFVSSFALIFAVLSFAALTWSQQRVPTNPYAQQQQAQQQRLQQSAASPASPAASAMPPGARRWEYNTVVLAQLNAGRESTWLSQIDGVEIPKSAAIKDMLNMAGGRGWELVSVVPQADPKGEMFYFKRSAP
jgi:hypothetical protein